MATARVMPGSSGQMKSEENMKHALSSNGKKLLEHKTKKNLTLPKYCLNKSECIFGGVVFTQVLL